MKSGKGVLLNDTSTPETTPSRQSMQDDRAAFICANGVAGVDLPEDGGPRDQPERLRGGSSGRCGPDRLHLEVGTRPSGILTLVRRGRMGRASPEGAPHAPYRQASPGHDALCPCEWGARAPPRPRTRRDRREVGRGAEDPRHAPRLHRHGPHFLAGRDRQLRNLGPVRPRDAKQEAP